MGILEVYSSKRVDWAIAFEILLCGNSLEIEILLFGKKDHSKKKLRVNCVILILTYFSNDFYLRNNWVRSGG